MLKSVARITLATLLSFSGCVAAQDRPSCALLKGLDLKPLLGADHDAPVPFGKEGCRAESKSPGRMVVLSILDAPNELLKKRIGNIRKLNETELAKQVAVVAEPSLGPDGFSTRERGENRQMEIFAIKGNRAIAMTGVRAVGAPIDDAGAKQFVGVAKAALDKLP